MTYMNFIWLTGQHSFEKNLLMKKPIVRAVTLSLIFTAPLGVPTMSLAQEKTPSNNESAAATAVAQSAENSLNQKQPSEAEMKKMMEQMMELGKPSENHKLLAPMAGNWTYTVKMMDPSANPQESKGTASRKPILDGRFFLADYVGKFQMPGPDGKMKEMNFKGMAIEGYDNVKKKFVASWIDNMGTMILNSEGTYDPSSKTFTYNAQCEMLPGMPMRIREVIRIVDNDHHNFEWYEDRGSGETKTMEIAYTRKK